MARVIISDRNQNQLFEVQFASNVKWRKSLDAIGYASFDIPLTNAYATPSWIHAGNYIHIFNDSADSRFFANADWGGILDNDYEIKPKDGVLSVSAAGMAQLLEVAIVTTTTQYANIDLGSIVQDLVTNVRDNVAAVPLTAYTVSALGPTVNSYIAGFGDIVMEDLIKLMQSYACDFEVRPDFTYAFYARQGQDRPDLVCRYGDQGNISLESTIHLVNTELANSIFYFNDSASVYVANPSAVQYYGKKSASIQDDGSTLSDLDLTTKAQVELAHRQYPLFVLDKITLTDTPLLPFAQLNLGDRVTFEAPSIPFLSSFNGLQRILAIDYDDTQRTMDLTMGNAVYVVVKGKLHQVRLYT